MPSRRALHADCRGIELDAAAWRTRPSPRARRRLRRAASARARRRTRPAGRCGAARGARPRPLRGARAGARRARRRPRRDREPATLEALVARRAAREPLQHITGRAPFRHLELRVGPGVFVPRPETESRRAAAIDALRAAASPAPIAVDLGTGSGAIALALATEVPHARVFAAENSRRRVPVDARRTSREVGADNARAGLHRPRARLARARRHGSRSSSPTRRMFRMPRSRVTPRCASTIRRRGALRRTTTGSTWCACSERRRTAPRAPGRHARDRARRVAGGGRSRDPRRRRLAGDRPPPRPHVARPRDDRRALSRGIRPGLTWRVRAVLVRGRVAHGRVVPVRRARAPAARVRAAPVRARA